MTYSPDNPEDRIPHELEQGLTDAMTAFRDAYFDLLQAFSKVEEHAPDPARQINNFVKAQRVTQALRQIM